MFLTCQGLVFSLNVLIKMVLIKKEHIGSHDGLYPVPLYKEKARVDTPFPENVKFKIYKAAANCRNQNTAKPKNRLHMHVLIVADG